MDEQDRDPPRWIPYSPPPANRWGRVRDFLRRLLFPTVVLLFGAGVAGGLYWLSQPENNLSSTTVNVTPASEAPGRSAEAPGESGGTQLTIQSRPAGASVWINGDSIGRTPVREHSLPSGVYFLSLRSEGYFSTDTVAVLSEETDPVLTFSLEARPGNDPSTGRPESLAEQSPEEIQPRVGTEPVEEQAVPTGLTPGELAGESTEAPSQDPPSDASSQEESSVPATGTLRVTSDPEGASVIMNGSFQGQTPLTLDELPPGSREVVLQMEGYESWSETVNVEANATQEVQSTLQRQMGQLRVLAEPWGTIYIDDSLHVRQTDIWYQTEVPIGSRQIRVVHPSLGEQSQTVEVQGEEQTELIINLREESEEQR